LNLFEDVLVKARVGIVKEVGNYNLGLDLRVCSLDFLLCLSQLVFIPRNKNDVEASSCKILTVCLAKTIGGTCDECPGAFSLVSFE